MRNSFISTFIAFAFIANLSAQIKVNSLGSVGIGTSNPQYKLDVVGTISAGNIKTGNLLASAISSLNRSSLVFMVDISTVVGSTGSLDDTNVSFGYEALTKNYSRHNRNTAHGHQALLENTSGSSNTANGYNALISNTTGSYNTAIGSEALRYHTVGNYNTAIGMDALRYFSIGSCNTAIGSYTGVSSDYSNVTVIGYGANATSNNQVRIGNSNVTSIGGYAPWSNLSDGRVKKNIKADVPGLDFINRLQPVTYNLNLDALDNLMKTDKTEKSELSQELTTLNKRARETRQKQVQTGFVAQDVEKTAKSIGYNFSGVDVDELGIYALKYSEFVVPLVKAVQELSGQNDKFGELLKEQQGIIEELKQKIEKLEGNTPIANLRSYAGESMLTDVSNAVIEPCKLYQNVPNPFTQDTQIQFYISENVAVAQLCIYNLQGTQIKQIQITQRGEGSQQISGSELAAGMYLYALIADGKEVDTKRMILTK